MSDVLVEVRECEVCKAALRIVHSDEREVSYDIGSDEEHECFDVPESAELLIMDDPEADDDCAC